MAELIFGAIGWLCAGMAIGWMLCAWRWRACARADITATSAGRVYEVSDVTPWDRAEPKPEEMVPPDTDWGDGGCHCLTCSSAPVISKTETVRGES